MALALAAGCKQVTEIQTLFDNVGKLTWFLGGSAKRKAIIEHVSAASKENDDLAEQLLQTDDDMLNESDIAIKQGSHKKSVPKFCATRWTARVDTLSALIAKYKLILEALDQIQDTSNGDAKRDAGTYIRLLSDSKFLVSLVVAQFILSYCSCVTKTLQAVNCDLGKAYKDVHMSKEAIANARNETTWNKVWGRIESIAEAVDITITKPRTVSIQRHRSNAGHDQRQSPKDYFMVNVYYQFIDHIVQELDTRFSDQHYGLISGQALVPCNLDQLTSTCINSIKGYYSKFIEREENLDVEADKWTTFYNKVPVESRPQDICSALAACDPNYFPAINRILVIFCTTPFGSVACERSFSALRRLKLWTRASMSEDRLSSLAMLQVHRNTELIPKPELIYSRKSNWRYLLN